MTCMRLLNCAIYRNNALRLRKRLILRTFTTAYSGEPGDGRFGMERLSYMPYQAALRNGRRVEIGPLHATEMKAGINLMNLVIREGRSWPFDQEFRTMQDFQGYFLSHTAFCVRSVEEGLDTNGSFSPKGDFMGQFYIKPNYPGRCSHICNGGFISEPRHRRQGVATLMGQVFLQCAKDLGYRSAYFNLVFRSNRASIRLWEKLGFERVAVLEEAADLEGLDYLDTAYGYRYDLTSLPINYLKESIEQQSY